MHYSIPPPSHCCFVAIWDTPSKLTLFAWLGNLLPDNSPQARADLEEEMTKLQAEEVKMERTITDLRLALSQVCVASHFRSVWHPVGKSPDRFRRRARPPRVASV